MGVCMVEFWGERGEGRCDRAQSISLRFQRYCAFVARGYRAPRRGYGMRMPSATIIRETTPLLGDISDAARFGSCPPGKCMAPSSTHRSAFSCSVRLHLDPRCVVKPPTLRPNRLPTSHLPSRRSLPAAIPGLLRDLGQLRLLSLPVEIGVPTMVNLNDALLLLLRLIRDVGTFAIHC